jgi:hypothetical protein
VKLSCTARVTVTLVVDLPPVHDMWSTTTIYTQSKADARKLVEAACSGFARIEGEPHVAAIITEETGECE